jgi:hypothetical protein
VKIGDKLKQIIGVAAPTIGTALGGPLGGLAGTFVSKALGVDDEQAAVEKLNTDPAALAQLRSAELDFKQHLDDNQISLEQIAAADRASARGREVQLHDRTPSILAWTIVGAFIAMAAAVLFGWAVAESTIAGTIIGYLSAKCELVIAYYFGSSAGSKAKDAALAEIAKQP